MRCFNGRLALIIIGFILLAYTLAGCTVASQMYTIVYLSDEVDMAQKRGWITDAKEDELQDKLYSATVIYSTPFEYGLSDCPEAQNKNECIDDILTSIELELRGDR